MDPRYYSLPGVLGPSDLDALQTTSLRLPYMYTEHSVAPVGGEVLKQLSSLSGGLKEMRPAGC